MMFVATLLRRLLVRNAYGDVQHCVAGTAACSGSFYTILLMAWARRAVRRRRYDLHALQRFRWCVRQFCAFAFR